MKFVKGNTGLEITADAEEQAALKRDREVADYFDSDEYMTEMLADDLANSDLDWVGPEEVGALTSAPMLGARDESGEVVEAYGFMDYAIVSVQGRLADDGFVIFQKG